MNTPARRNVPPLVFPSSPAPGELFGGLWQWDGQKWGAAGLGGLPPDAIDEVPDIDIYAREDGDWVSGIALPTLVSFGNNHLQIGSILFQWGYVYNTAAADNWIVMPRMYAAMPCVLLSANHLLVNNAEINITAGLDHEDYAVTPYQQWAYRMRYQVSGGGVHVAGQGFFWLAVGVAA